MSARQQRGSARALLLNGPDDRGLPRWAGPRGSERVIVQGFDLTGAMVYLAEPGLPRSMASEPSEIDPTLPLTGADTSLMPSYYARAYRDLAPQQRRAYLTWLAEGRRDPGVDRTFVRLYMHGLERRVLVDSAMSPAAAEELPFIAKEVMELHKTYEHHLASGFADQLIELLALLLTPAGHDLPAPRIDATHWNEPMLLRFGLGRFVAQKRPIPAEWAAVWSWYRRDVVIRSALTRIPDEYCAVFAHHYTETYGEGLTFKNGKREVTLNYYSANPSINLVRIDLPGIPDIFSRPAAGQKLRALAEQTWVDLGPYARAINRSFMLEESLSIAALLPPLLQSRDYPPIGEALKTLDLTLGEATHVTLPHADLAELWWPPQWHNAYASTQLSAKDRKTFTALVGNFGYGVEPDARFGKRPGQRATDDLTIFRAGEAISGTPSDAWNASVVATQMAAAVVAQEDDLDESMAAHLATEIAEAFAIPPSEAIRIQIMLTAMVASDDPVKITGMKAFLDPLTEAERERIGTFAVEVAARSGSVSPSVVTLVQKISRALNLDPSAVPSRLFGAMTRTPSASDTERRPAKRSKAHALELDHAAIAATTAATAAVSDLLGDLLAEEEDRSTKPAPSSSATVSIAGLDAAHTAMLRDLAASGDAAWTSTALDALAQAHHLLGAGAVDRLNDAALDLADEPLLIEDDGGFALDRDVLGVLLTASDGESGA
ncbi:MAG: TerB N-terminal domain-containing protein [Thermomicrobiales bacterium]